jgi:hypothetical protein
LFPGTPGGTGAPWSSTTSTTAFADVEADVVERPDGDDPHLRRGVQVHGSGPRRLHPPGGVVGEHLRDADHDPRRDVEVAGQLLLGESGEQRRVADQDFGLVAVEGIDDLGCRHGHRQAR